MKIIRNSKGLILEPLPRIQVNYKEIKDIELINQLMVLFPKDSVREAMKNNKIVLVLK